MKRHDLKKEKSSYEGKERKKVCGVSAEENVSVKVEHPSAEAVYLNGSGEEAACMRVCDASEMRIEGARLRVVRREYPSPHPSPPLKGRCECFACGSELGEVEVCVC